MLSLVDLESLRLDYGSECGVFSSCLGLIKCSISLLMSRVEGRGYCTATSLETYFQSLIKFSMYFNVHVP